MKRIEPFSLALSLTSCLALLGSFALTGCSKKSEDTQNPDDVAAEGGDGSAEGEGDGDTAGRSSRARGSTATRSGGRKTKARQMTAKRPPRGDLNPPTEEDTGPYGLLAEGFALDSADAMPKDFAALGDPAESFTVKNLDFDEDDAANGFPGSKGLTENYAIRFSGSINIVEEAEYELCLHSDDGSQMLLEDTLLVDNDGVHDEAVEACELVYLAPGEYMLEVRYLQSTGPLMTMHMAWAINGGDKEIIPGDVLFKPAG